MTTAWTRLIVFCAVLLMLAGCAKKTPDEMLKDADELIQQNNLLEAQIKYEDIIEQYPDNPAVNQARLGLAAIYNAQRNFLREREQYDILLKKSGGPATLEGWTVYSQKIRSLMKEGQPKKALDDAVATSDTFKKAPVEGRHVFQLMLADLYLYNNDTKSALKILDAQSVGGFNDPQAQFEILSRKTDILSRAKDWQKVTEAQEAYLKRYPQTPLKSNLLFLLGVNYQEMKNQAKADEAFDASAVAAQQAYDKAVGANEKCKYLLQLAGLYQYRTQYDKAEQYLNKLIKEYPQNQLRIPAMFGLSEIALARKDQKKAIEILNDIGRIFPNSDGAKAAAARIRQLEGGTTKTLTTVPAIGGGVTTATRKAAPQNSKTTASAESVR